ncbi:MAG: ABC transporter substrate-binding protein [Acidobacteriota bacterium]
MCHLNSSRTRLCGPRAAASPPGDNPARVAAAGRLLAIAALFACLAVPGCRKENGGEAVRGRIGFVQYIDSPMSEDAARGFTEGLAASGLKDGTDYRVESFSANGDVVTVNSIIDNAVGKDYDLLMVLSSPTLQAALNKVKQTPIVFTVIADPIAAGAGKSFTDHLPNVTGIATLGDYEGMARIVARLLPSVKTVGTLYAPGEINSVVNKEKLTEYAQQAGISVVATPVNSTADVADAALSLAGRNVGAICQVLSNLTDAAFPTIAQAAQKSRLPLFWFDEKHAAEGPVVTLSRDYVQAGRDAAAVAVRILNGESPAGIPFAQVSKSRLIINRRAANSLGISVPDDLLKQADRVIGD